MRKKILVLGASGFVGQNCYEGLALLGHEVYGTYYQHPTGYLPSNRYLYCNLLNVDSINSVLDAISPDVIVQAAAVTTNSKDVLHQPYVHVTDNAVMNSLLFRACHDKFIDHVLFFSCSTMYASKDAKQKESDWSRADLQNSVYFGVGSTKVYIEDMCDFYSRLGRTQYTAIRHSNVFGPYDRFDLARSHVFGAMVNKVMNSKDGNVEVIGSAEARRDLLYVSDLVRFVALAIEKQTAPYELFNVGTGKAYSVLEMIDKISEVAGKKVNVVYKPGKSIPTTTYLDCTKAYEKLGWLPSTGFTTGVTKTIEYFKQCGGFS